MREPPPYYDLILAAAASLGAKIEAAPDTWTGAAFNAEVLSTGRPAFQRDTRDLPTHVAAARIDGTPLLLGELKGPAIDASIADQTRRYRNQASIARSWLGVEGPNLQLFLVGPDGAIHDRDWVQQAQFVEADDRICRKLVWLCDNSPTLEEAVDFLGRTFIAIPWDPEPDGRADLDQMEIGLPTGWEQLVDDERLTPEDLVNEIVRLEGEAK